MALTRLRTGGIAANAVVAASIAPGAVDITDIADGAVTTNKLAANAVVAAKIAANTSIQFAAGTALLPSITATGDVNTGVFFPAADRMGLSTGGTQRVEVDVSGNFGINDTNPAGVLGTTAGGLIVRDGGRAGTTTQVAFLNSSGNITFGMTAGGSFTQNSLPAFVARAFVNFNGSGTVAIRASGNVSSITDLGTGSYEMNFSTAMPDSDYSAVMYSNTTGTNAANPCAYLLLNRATTKIQVNTGNDPVFTASVDHALVMVSIFR